MNKHTLNLRNQLCPLPIIKTQAAIKKLQAGDELTIVCTDPGALRDIPSWCRISGHRLLDTEERADGDIILKIRAGTSQASAW